MPSSFTRVAWLVAAFVLALGLSIGARAQNPAGGQPPPPAPSPRPAPTYHPPAPTEWWRQPWFLVAVVVAIFAWLRQERHHKGAPPIWAAAGEAPQERRPAVALLGCLVYFSIAGGVLVFIFSR